MEEKELKIPLNKWSAIWFAIILVALLGFIQFGMAGSKIRSVDDYFKAITLRNEEGIKSNAKQAKSASGIEEIRSSVEELKEKLNEIEHKLDTHWHSRRKDVKVYYRD